MMRVFALVLWAVVAIVSCPARAETLQERVAAAQRRWEEYRELMESSDPIARSEGFNAALADENLGVRNNALWAYMHKRDRLPLEVVVETGGRYGPGDLPNVALINAQWNAEQRALEARVVSFGATRSVTGLIVAGKLQLRFQDLVMPSFVGQSRSASGGRPEFAGRNCTSQMAVNAARDALEGRLACEGLPETLPLRMPFG